MLSPHLEVAKCRFTHRSGKFRNLCLLMHHQLEQKDNQAEVVERLKSCMPLAACEFWLSDSLKAEKKQLIQDQPMQQLQSRGFPSFCIHLSLPTCCCRGRIYPRACLSVHTKHQGELRSLQTNCLDLTVMSGWRIISARQRAVTGRPVKARTWEIYT